jgi:hypothetical protein
MTDLCIKGCGAENWNCECKPDESDIIAYSDEYADGSWEGNTWGAFWRFLEAWESGMEVYYENEEGSQQKATLVTIDKTDPQLPFSVDFLHDDGTEDHEWVKEVTIHHFVIAEEI